ncbi:MAG: hypothetical protein Q6365_021330, partial [Candidatus Sigynarchaeota archaeon]
RAAVAEPRRRARPRASCPRARIGGFLQSKGGFLRGASEYKPVSIPAGSPARADPEGLKARAASTIA